jgi:hypothetical protein
MGLIWMLHGETVLELTAEGARLAGGLAFYWRPALAADANITMRIVGPPHAADTRLRTAEALVRKARSQPLGRFGYTAGKDLARR